MWRTRRRWMDDLAKVLFKISNQKSNMKTSWVINRIKTCIVKRDRRLLTSFSMWQNSLINRASPWKFAKQFENNDARKISSIKIWNLVSQRMFQPFPHSLDRHYHWRSPNNSIKAGWGLKLSWIKLPHAHRQYGMYDGICLIIIKCRLQWGHVQRILANLVRSWRFKIITTGHRPHQARLHWSWYHCKLAP